MTIDEMKKACEDAAYEVDDFAKYRDLKAADCAAAIKELIKVVAELVRREEERKT